MLLLAPGYSPLKTVNAGHAIFFIIACEFTIIHVGLPCETDNAAFWHYGGALLLWEWFLVYFCHAKIGLNGKWFVKKTYLVPLFCIF